jgi:hypothetical protein
LAVLEPAHHGDIVVERPPAPSKEVGPNRITISGVGLGTSSKELQKKRPGIFHFDESGRLRNSDVWLTLDEKGLVEYIEAFPDGTIELNGKQIFALSDNYSDVQRMLLNTPGFKVLLDTGGSIEIKAGSQRLVVGTSWPSAKDGNRGDIRSVSLYWD